MIKSLDIKAWVNDSFVKESFKAQGLDYDRQLASFSGYDVGGTDNVCMQPVTKPLEAG